MIHKIPLPRDAPKANSEERTIWDKKTMLAALQTIENPALHLAVHMSMVLSLREGEILGLQPSDLDFDAADGRGTISVSKTMQRANKDALEKLDPKQVYYTFPDRREGSKSSLILKKPKTKKSNRVLYMTKPLKEELLAWLEKLKQDEQNAPEKYSNCGQLFRLPDGLPIAPELLTKPPYIEGGNGMAKRPNILKLATKISLESMTYMGITYDDPEYKILEPIIDDDMCAIMMHLRLEANRTVEDVARRAKQSVEYTQTQLDKLAKTGAVRYRYVDGPA